MKKIPSLFVRDYERIITEFKPHSASLMPDGSTSMAHEITKSEKGRFLATEQVTPGCEWAINGEGVATRKWDGTAVMARDGFIYKRFDAKHGKTPPQDFEPCQDPDPVTGHWPGWVLVDPMDPGNRWIMEAVINSVKPIKNGTYEAVGPKIGSNKDNVAWHILFRHGEDKIMGNFAFTHTFGGLRELLEKIRPDIEGIVFHHPDGRMCKVKRSDFGLPW